MTQEEIAARKVRAFIVLAVGIAALICSYIIGYVLPSNSVSVMTAILLTAIFFGCMFVAARMAIQLSKDSASR